MTRPKCYVRIREKNQQQENVRLKRLVVEKELDIYVPKEVLVFKQ
jgi:hypothetical protein